MMLKTFTFDGLNSGDFGLYVLESNIHNSPERLITKNVYQGNNGVSIADEFSYKNIEIVFKVALYGSRNNLKADIMLEDDGDYFLQDGRYGYKKLMSDYEPGIYREAIFKGGIDWKTKLRRYGQCELTFLCKPYRYSTTDITESQTINNGVEKTLYIYSSSGISGIIRNQPLPYKLQFTFSGATTSTSVITIADSDGRRLRLKCDNPNIQLGSKVVFDYDTGGAYVLNSLGDYQFNQTEVIDWDYTTYMYPQYTIPINSYNTLKITNSTGGTITADLTVKQILL